MSVAMQRAASHAIRIDHWISGIVVRYVRRKAWRVVICNSGRAALPLLPSTAGGVWAPHPGAGAQAFLRLLSCVGAFTPNRTLHPALHCT